MSSSNLHHASHGVRNLPCPLTPPRTDDRLPPCSDDTYVYARELKRLRHLELKHFSVTEIDAKVEALASLTLLPHHQCGKPRYPSLLVNSYGTISVLVNPDVSIEISLNRIIKIECLGHFSLCMTISGGSFELSHRSVLLTQNFHRCIVNDLRPGKERQIQCHGNSIMYTHQKNDVTWTAAKQEIDSGGVIKEGVATRYHFKKNAVAKSFFKAADTKEDVYSDVCHEFIRRADYKVNSEGTQFTVNGYKVMIYNSGIIRLSLGLCVIRFVCADGRVQVKTPYISFGITGIEESYYVFDRERVFFAEDNISMAIDDNVFQFNNNGNIINETYVQAEPEPVEEPIEDFQGEEYSIHSDDETVSIDSRVGVLADIHIVGPYGDLNGPFYSEPEEDEI